MKLFTFSPLGHIFESRHVSLNVKLYQKSHLCHNMAFTLVLSQHARIINTPYEFNTIFTRNLSHLLLFKRISTTGSLDPENSPPPKKKK